MSNRDFDDELAGHLTVATVLGAFVLMIVGILVAISAVAMLILLWQVYERHGRRGQPEAAYLHRLAAFAGGGFFVALLFSASEPGFAFWLALGTFLTWTLKTYETGLKLEQIATTRAEEEMESLSKLSNYLAPFDATRHPAQEAPIEGNLLPETQEPLSMVVRMHAFGQRWKNLGDTIQSEKFETFSEIFAYMISPDPPELATVTNVRLLLRQ